MEVVDPGQRTWVQAVAGLKSVLGEDLVAVVLFGSQARGRATAESDWDLLVIAEELPADAFERHLLFRRALQSADQVPVSILGRTPSEFEACLQPVYLDIALEGRILHDPRGYGGARLGGLRKLIRKVGLYRESTEAGDVWRWRTEPVGTWRLQLGGWNMEAADDVRYRLRLAEGFLGEAREDIQLRRWRSCVDNSQLAVENAAKTALAILGPIGRTHDPAALLYRALAEQRFRPQVRDQVTRIAECAQLLGPDVHVETGYGREAEGRTPWELFDEPKAEQTLALAEEAVDRARSLAEREL